MGNFLLQVWISRPLEVSNIDKPIPYQIPYSTLLKSLHKLYMTLSKCSRKYKLKFSSIHLSLNWFQTQPYFGEIWPKSVTISPGTHPSHILLSSLKKHLHPTNQTLPPTPCLNSITVILNMLLLSPQTTLEEV